MDEQTKRKYDRIVNWALAASIVTMIISAFAAADYRAQNQLLRAELQRLQASPPARDCPASIQLLTYHRRNA